MPIKLKQVSKDFYIHHGKTNSYHKVNGRKVVIEGFEGHDLFSHKQSFYDYMDEPTIRDDMGFTISEGRTGLLVYRGHYQDKLLTVKIDARDSLLRWTERKRMSLHDMIDAEVRQGRVSPRYERED